MSCDVIKSELIARLSDRSAAVAVIGLGYVGLPLAVAFARAGYRTIGIDVDDRKVAALNAGESYVADVPPEQVAALVRAGRLQATGDSAVLRGCDAVSVCVPTPLSKTRDPDLSFVIAAADAVAAQLHAGMLVVLESTTYPGTTEEIIVPRIASNGYRVGRDIFVAFSPERVDPGQAQWTIENTPKVLGGVTPECLEVAEALYQRAIEHVVPVSSTATAEMVKLLENTFRAVNIALVNEVLLMCDRLGLDAWEVIAAAATKPYGFMKFTPGPGVGGHCLAGAETVRYRWGTECGEIALEALFGRMSEHSGRAFAARHIGIVMADGLEVLSLDPETGLESWQRVTHLFRRDFTGPFVDIETGHGRRLTVTGRHPMLVAEANEQNELAIHDALTLRPGDLLPVAEALEAVPAGGRAGWEPVRPEGAYGLAAVTRVSVREDRMPVYSVEVADTHTFATTGGIYVHNCIPLDPRYLSWKLRSLDYNARFIQLAEEINAGMPAYWVNRVADALNQVRRAVKGSRVLVLGVTYKPDVADVRESPALDVIRLLEARGADVTFHDPYVRSLVHEGLDAPYAELTEEAVARADCVIVVTNHTAYDWDWVARHARVIVDTRHVVNRRTAREAFAVMA
jgi:UDP-N-acetyl-D-mannosaminuronate dehydrogenase